MKKKFAIVLALFLIAVVCSAGCIDPEDPVDPIDPVDPVDPITPVDPVDPVVPTEEYSVMFMLNYGDAGAYTAETVKAGETVSKPASPTRSGYTFNGWFTAAEGGAAYDFTQPVNADVTLYAQWKKKSSSSSGGHSHSYTTLVSTKAPTCTEGGYALYKCSCGATENRDHVAATGHALFINGSYLNCSNDCGYSEFIVDTAVAAVESTGNTYDTFASALANTTDDDTIALLKAVNDQAQVTKSVTINASGFNAVLKYTDVAHIKILADGSDGGITENVTVGDAKVYFEVGTGGGYVADTYGNLIVAYTVDGSTYTVYTDYGLEEAIEKVGSSGTILLTPRSYGVIDVVVDSSDNRIFTIAASGAGVKIAGIDGQINSITFNPQITVKGVTIDNSLQTEGWYTGTSPNINPCVGVWGGSYTFEDCTFNVVGTSGAETGVMSWWTVNTGTMNFTNCTFNGDSSSARAMQIYGNYNLNVEECTFNTAKDYSIKYVGEPGLTATFENNKVYNTVNFVQTGSAPYAGEDYSLVFTGNTLADGINHVYVDNDEGQTITINGARYVSSADKLAAAVAAGATNILLADGEYDVYGCGGKTLTLTGTKDSVLNIVGGEQGEANGQLDYGFDSSTVDFYGVTIKSNNQTYAGYARLAGNYTDCTFENVYTLNGNSEFTNCKFNVSGDQYNIWTWGAPTATFTGCTFNSDGKALLLYGTADTKLTLIGCTFNDNGKLSDKKAAVEIGNDYNKAYELIVNDCTVNGYEINDKGINTGTTLWGNKNSMGQDKLNVVVDGVDVY